MPLTSEERIERLEENFRSLFSLFERQRKQFHYLYEAMLQLAVLVAPDDPLVALQLELGKEKNRDA